MSRHTHYITKAQAEKFFIDFKGCSFITFFYKREIKADKWQRACLRQFLGNVSLIEKLTLNFGIEYQKSVEGKSNDGTYDNEGLPTYMRYKAYKKVLVNLHNGEILIRTYVVKNSTVTKKYVVNNRFATKKDMRTIVLYEKPSKPYVCKKQLAKGITNQTECRNLQLDGIIGFKVNGQTYKII